MGHFCTPIKEVCCDELKTKKVHKGFLATMYSKVSGSTDGVLAVEIHTNRGIFLSSDDSFL